MTETDFPEAELLALLAKHFPHVQDERLRQAAYEIELAVDVGRCHEGLDARKKSSVGDIRHLEDARRHLEKARGHILKIGVWGGRKLREPARRIEAFEGDQFADCEIPSTRVTAVIAEHITALLDVLPKAVDWEGDDGTDESMIAATGRPTKREPRHLAAILYRTYADLAGRKPTVSTNVETGRKYGPFLSLVKDTFSLLKVEANAENAALEAVKPKSP